MPSARNSTMFQLLIPQADDRCDGELLKQFVDHRDESAFGEIVRRHGPMVYGACKRILNNGSDADDAFQATFFVLARRAGHIRSSNAVGAWLHSVAVKVARKSLQQVMKRRKRQMAAAKPEAVHPATPVADWWAVIDEELDKLPDNLRQVILACDIDGQSRSRAARELGWAEGTVAKRLAKARQELAKRLTRRGVTLGVAALSASLTAEIKAAVPSRLLAETISQAPAFALGSKVGSLAARVLAEGVMRSMKSHALTFWLLAGLIVTTLAGGGIMLAGAPAKPPETKTSKLFANVLPADVKKESSVWKEKAQIEMPGWLPVSVAFSSDGKTMVVGGGTGGKVIAYHTATRREKWSADVGGDFAAVVFSADGTSVLATFRDGVRFIDAETGKFGDAIEESGALRDWRMMAVGVFPDRAVEGGMQKLISHKIILGTPLGYVIKTWIDSGPPSTIKTSTVGADNNVADPNAIPLAVDPAGGSAIITGPIDRDTGKNVLWAYVAGNNDKARPGNRILEGHQARVVSAAWSRNGKTAITGDSEGRVIIWDAKTMKEKSRVELGQRIAAVAVNSDGTQVAAAAVGKQADFYVWETAKTANNMKPIQSDAYDYQGSVFACLAFSPDDRQLVGCAIDRAWLNRLGELVGKLHIWEATNANPQEKPPDAQPTAVQDQKVSFEGSKVGDKKELVPGIAFRWCPAGKFKMGEGEDAVDVELSKGFWLGETEVTQGQWKKLMGTCPWSGRTGVGARASTDTTPPKEGSNYAASYISYDEALSFCKKLTTQEQDAGRLPKSWKYSLPTEAQWEYACRAGTRTRFSFGDDESQLNQYAWFGDNVDKMKGDSVDEMKEPHAHQVGLKKPNAWGLCDMHGNVCEWCNDWYASKRSGGKDPVGPTTPPPPVPPPPLPDGTPGPPDATSARNRVIRGGSWVDVALGCTSANRFYSPGFGNSVQGFRVAAVPASE